MQKLTLEENESRGRGRPSSITGVGDYRRLTWTRAFLAVLAQRANVSRAAEVAGVHRNTAYDLKYRDPAFDIAWQDAVDHAVDALQESAWNDAVSGIKRKKFTPGGKPIIDPETKQQYFEQETSVPLKIFLLKAHRPDVYRDNPRVTINVLNQAFEREAVSRGLSPEELVDAMHRVLLRMGTPPQELLTEG